MKIIDKKDNSKPYAHVKVGQVFKITCTNSVYIKTDIVNERTGCYYAINLESGTNVLFDKKEFVEVITAEVHIV